MKRWIACRLEFKGWKRAQLLQPGRYTELFFLDEATAFAAGHRPCALCRRADYNRFVGARRRCAPTRSTSACTAERLDGVARAPAAPGDAATDLPDGAFVLEDGEPWLVLGDELLRWTPSGYAERRPRPEGETPC